jgi:predicted RecA/RadA family phage recombinase
MAFEVPGKMYTGGIANADFTAEQYKGCILNSSGMVVLAGLNAPSLLGVIQNKPGAGEAVSIMMDGISIMIAGAALTPGPVALDAQGRVVAAAANPVVGYALEGAGAAGIHVPVMLGGPN